MTDAERALLHAACFVSPRPWSEAEFRDLSQDRFCFIEETPDALAVGRVIVDEAELLTIAVHPAQRKQGQGRALLARFLATARARGAQTAFLEVAADNAAAIALYQNAGFEQTGRRKGYYHHPDGKVVDALIMARPVS